MTGASTDEIYGPNASADPSSVVYYYNGDNNRHWHCWESLRSAKS